MWLSLDGITPGEVAHNLEVETDASKDGVSHADKWSGIE
jgi:hypothetical protein